MAHLFGLLTGDDALVGQVGLVGHEDGDDGVGGAFSDAAQPVLDVFETGAVRRVVDEEDAVRAAVVRRRDGAESLLSGRVPGNVPLAATSALASRGATPLDN